MVDAHLVSVAGLYALQLAIIYKLGRIEGRLHLIETRQRPAKVKP